jgi:SWI/SNF-related matrix-associated actin-dependent regulator of chromatin subfamily A member 5
MSYVRLQGSAAERWRVISSDTDGTVDVYLTTYETILSEEAFFTEQKLWHTLTIDEGHRLKKEDSTLSLALGRVQAPFRLLLTGTPLQNNLHELFALLHFLLPKVSSLNQLDSRIELSQKKSCLSCIFWRVGLIITPPPCHQCAIAGIYGERHKGHF